MDYSSWGRKESDRTEHTLLVHLCDYLKQFNSEWKDCSQDCLQASLMSHLYAAAPKGSCVCEEILFLTTLGLKAVLRMAIGFLQRIVFTKSLTTAHVYTSLLSFHSLEKPRIIH